MKIIEGNRHANHKTKENTIHYKYKSILNQRKGILREN